MKYQFSFATVNVLTDAIVEVIVNEGVEISIEMVEEIDELLHRVFTDNFAVIINKINNYRLSFGSKMMLASHENIRAIAVIVYNNDGKDAVKDIQTARAIDNLNLKSFSGLELGWQRGYDWLQEELKSSAKIISLPSES